MGGALRGDVVDTVAVGREGAVDGSGVVDAPATMDVVHEPGDDMAKAFIEEETV